MSRMIARAPRGIARCVVVVSDRFTQRRHGVRQDVEKYTDDVTEYVHVAFNARQHLVGIGHGSHSPCSFGRTAVAVKSRKRARRGTPGYAWCTWDGER